MINQAIDNQPLMFYKLDCGKRQFNIISDLEKYKCDLIKAGYELIYLNDLSFLNIEKNRLPLKSFLIAIDEKYSCCLIKALPYLTKMDKSIIIFLPIPVSNNAQHYQKEKVQQLNEFIFSDEFKNIFGYTQPSL